jgi:transketolase
VRNAFADELLTVAERDERVVFLSGDIGNRLFDKFKAKFPDRFYNCGVAEQNMMGMAAGLAMCGLRPICYTITPFTTTRCLEQIRVDVCYHHVPVIIAGVGAGLCYAELGATHHACEDIAFLRMLPTMTVMCPGDPMEARCALDAAVRHDGPVYLRMGKKGEPVVHQQRPDFQIGRGIVMAPGTDVALLVTGIPLPAVMHAAETLRSHGISPHVVSLHTVKPLDEALLADVFGRCKIVATIEEHSIMGGLGGAVAEWLVDHLPQKGKLVRIGTSDEFLHEAADEEYARRRFGLDAPGIAKRVATEFSKV